MRRTTRIYALVAFNLVALIALGGSLLVAADRESNHARAQYEQNRDHLSTALKQAQAQGFTAADLQPISGVLTRMDRAKAPSWAARPGPVLSLTGQHRRPAHPPADCA